MSHITDILTPDWLEEYCSKWYNTTNLLENYGNLEEKMRKTIIVTVLFVLLIFAMTGVVNAEENVASSQTVSSLSVYTYPSKTVYGAFERFDTSGLSLRAVFSDGSEKILSGQDIRVSYSKDNCFRVGDDSVMLSYGGKEISIPITVNRIAYDISSLDLSEFSTVFNGVYQSYNRSVIQIVGLDGIALTIKISGGGINVGVYDINIDFSTESSDYLTPESRVISMTIEPATSEIIWETLSFVYDGKSKTPTAYYIDVNGARVYPTVNGGATNAGSGYLARVTVSDPNYKFSNTSVNYEIKKADYDFSGVSWSKDSFTYDGSTKSISATGLPPGVSIIGYSGDRGSESGIYTATAILMWDENNYNSPPPLTHTWEIKKAEYDISGVSFRSESFIFDGMMHYPTLVGSMPVGADGIALEYSFSAGACHVADGTVSVVINFHTASTNYNLPEPLYSSVSITPCGINIIWGETKLSYNGEEQTPLAYAEECLITVRGSAINTGKYVATATTENTDYYIKNDKIEFSIIKAQNYWTVLPADSVCYEGKEINITGESKFGDVVIRFFADKDCNEEISLPTACGKYYAILSVSESENFGGLISDVISFEIVEIVAVSFLGGIIKDNIKAFEKLGSGDFLCSVLNNDGSVSVVDSSLVSVIYQEGDSFRKNDKWVKLQYGSFVLTLSVNVGYADYDMSGVVWLNTTQIYNGSALMPQLSGLPSGVSVSEYIGTNNINAGSYTVSAKLNYDRENYNEPKLSSCIFTIEKCPVNIPIFTTVYNGKGQHPVSDSLLYTVVSGDEYINSGTYTVSVRINDTANYCFAENSGDNANAIFQINPATVYVTVKDTKLKLFEKLSDVEYIITSGTVYENDILTVSSIREGKNVTVRSENPNYSIIATPGKIIRLAYPTAGGAVIMALILLGVVLIVLIAGAVYRNRQHIVSRAAMAKCKWHNREYKAPPPREDLTSILRYDPPVNKNDDAFVEDEESDFEETKETEEPLPTDPEIDEETGTIGYDVNMEKADSLISDSLAKSLIRREGEMICTDGDERATIEVGTLSNAFNPGDRVDVNSLKEKGIISNEVAYIKIIGGGNINKPLSVFANDFNLSAVKMIALCGGEATKIFTFKGRS